MGAVSLRQAGVGSAINDTTRLLGGTLGVAVIGSVYASLYSARLSAQLPAALPGRLTAVAHQSVGAALSVAGRLGAAGQRAAGGLVRDAATNAFLHGLTIGCLVAGGVAAGGAILAAVFLPAQPAGRAGASSGRDVASSGRDVAGSGRADADGAPAAGADRDAEVARAAQ